MRSEGTSGSAGAGREGLKQYTDPYVELRNRTIDSLVESCYWDCVNVCELAQRRPEEVCHEECDRVCIEIEEVLQSHAHRGG